MLGSLVATPFLFSRVIESQWQDAEIVSTGCLGGSWCNLCYK